MSLLDVQTATLPNGLRIVSSHLPHLESVSLGLWTGVGGRCEPLELSGASHFIEHMLFKGTACRSARKISEAIEGRGGHLNAFTQEESTCYYARVPRTQFRQALDVLCDMIRNSLFDPIELDRERGVIIEEILMVQDQPQQLVQEILGEALWKNHPVGRPLAGTPETMRSMDRTSLLDFKRRYYTAPNIVLSVAGNVAHAECAELAARFLGDLPNHEAPRFEPVRANQPQARFAIAFKRIEQANLALGFRLFGRRDPRRFAMRVLNVLVGENMSSRLFQIVREKHGLAYSVHSHVQLLHDTGIWIVEAGLDRTNVSKALRLILAEMAKLRDKPVGSAELRRAKDYLVGQIQLGWESTGNQMTWLGENLISLDELIAPEQVTALLRAVTAEDIQNLARSTLKSRRATLAAVLPDTLRDTAHDLQSLIRETPALA